MKLAISNIAIINEKDVYDKMHENAYLGLEIAPSISFKECYKTSDEEIEEYRNSIGFEVCSMQSLLYGYQENIFESLDSLNKTIEKMKDVILFASKLNCPNLVFGCPKNRNVNNEDEYNRSIVFFKTIGDFAYQNNTCIALEANPTIYNTNFLNSTLDNLEYVKKVNSKGLKINLDLGTVIYNNENLSGIINKENIDYINHVHISEPNLVPIDESHYEIHKELIELLKENNYDKYVSIEMKQNIKIIDKIEYVRELCK